MFLDVDWSFSSVQSKVGRYIEAENVDFVQVAGSDTEKIQKENTTLPVISRSLLIMWFSSNSFRAVELLLNFLGLAHTCYC